MLTKSWFTLSLRVHLEFAKPLALMAVCHKLHGICKDTFRGSSCFNLDPFLLGVGKLPVELLVIEGVGRY